MILFVFLLNLLLPGIGFLFNVKENVKFNTSINTNTNSKSFIVPKTLKLSRLLLAGMYCFFLISALLLVSWSGLIFYEKGFYYLLLAYAFVSLLSCVHLTLCLKKTNLSYISNVLAKPKPKLSIKIAVQVILPITYIASLLIILLNKPTLLGWQLYQIPSVSMFPTLKVGDIVLADTRTSTLNTLTNRDIVIFTRPVKDIGMNQSHQLSKISTIVDPIPIFYIKRLIASSGDFVSVSNHQLIVNSQVVKCGLTEKTRDEQQIKSSAFFVVGDNVNQSSDSRNWGQLPKSNVVAKFRRVVY